MGYFDGLKTLDHGVGRNGSCWLRNRRLKESASAPLSTNSKLIDI